MNNLTKQQQHQEAGYTYPYHYSDLASEEFRYIWGIENRHKLQQVINLLDLNNRDSVLDVGCGDGRFIYEVAGSVRTTTGLDYSEPALRYAKSFNPHTNFIQADINQFTSSQKVNKLVCLETLEHIPKSQVNQVVINLAQHLKPKGTCLITVPSNNLPLQPKHYQHFNETSLTHTLSSGFKQVEIVGFNQIGGIQKRFQMLRTFALFWYPFRTRIALVYSLFNYLDQYFAQRVAPAKPDSCLTLIAVCRQPKR